ncbi:amidohydrolase [Thermodesulfobacteriota bacterium]
MPPFDLIIKNGTFLTMDAGNSIIEDGFIGIQGDTISTIDKNHITDYSADAEIDAKGKLVLPGLVNGHTHAAMTLFRGLADDLPLMDWLNNYIFPVESNMDSEFVRTGTLLACAEMIMSGTTTFCDMYLFEEEVARAAKVSGIRCLAGEVLYDFDSPNYGSVENGLKYTESLLAKWHNDPLVSIAVEPHALFTCSPDLLKAANDIALKHNAPLIIHLSETEAEIQQIQEAYGKRPVAHLQSLGLISPHLIAAHCVHLNEQEIELLADSSVKVVHNPESNMKLASGIAPIPELLQKGVAVGLGTDGCASNNNLDLFTEMDTAAKLHKVHTGDTTVMDALTVLRMATIDGAKALGMGDITGSLETGKKADIIVIDTDKPHMTPMYNPFSHIVYSAAGSDVIHSVINGKLVMKDRNLITLDPGTIMADARERSERILASLPPVNFQKQLNRSE